MKKEYDFSRGKRGAVLSNAGKTRITIYLDNKPLPRFEAESEGTGKGYQTLINEALSRRSADAELPVTAKEVRNIVREELAQAWCKFQTPVCEDRRSRASTVANHEPLDTPELDDYSANLPVTQDEKQFFRALGARIAELRKAHGLTQLQLAETLKLSQQMIAPTRSAAAGACWSPYCRRSPMCSPSASRPSSGKRPPLPPSGDLPRKMDRIQRLQGLPKAQPRFGMQMIDTVLA